jgi:hypothetical protein
MARKKPKATALVKNTVRVMITEYIKELHSIKQKYTVTITTTDSFCNCTDILKKQYKVMVKIMVSYHKPQEKE